jgi:hypothetical protein
MCTPVCFLPSCSESQSGNMRNKPGGRARTLNSVSGLQSPRSGKSRPRYHGQYPPLGVGLGRKIMEACAELSVSAGRYDFPPPRGSNNIVSHSDGPVIIRLLAPVVFRSWTVTCWVPERPELVLFCAPSNSAHCTVHTMYNADVF